MTATAARTAGPSRRRPARRRSTTPPRPPRDREDGGDAAPPTPRSLRKRDGTTIGYSYDGLNRLTGRDLPAGAWYNFDRSFGYDVFRRLGSGSGNGPIALR